VLDWDRPLIRERVRDPVADPLVLWSQGRGPALADHASARCLQSIIALTYLSWGSRAIRATSGILGRDASVLRAGAGCLRSVERRLIWGQVRLVR